MCVTRRCRAAHAEGGSWQRHLPLPAGAVLRRGARADGCGGRGVDQPERGAPEPVRDSGASGSALGGSLLDRVAALAALHATALVVVVTDGVLARAALDPRGGAGGRDVDRVVALAAADLVAAVGAV